MKCWEVTGVSSSVAWRRAHPRAQCSRYPPGPGKQMCWMRMPAREATKIPKAKTR